MILVCFNFLPTRFTAVGKKLEAGSRLVSRFLPF